ncbi:MAG: LytR family transcriptional regulator [Clostridium sulfidigenes]|uniref:LytR family transcriptional regulator n=1 Tax=Clostridium sulfidigenes TaxID=318464 RepID=A0A927ZLQ7_9CLOT|nr:LytR family transcriptional regulator [Clostridium sulfidigenes]
MNKDKKIKSKKKSKGLTTGKKVLIIIATILIFSLSALGSYLLSMVGKLNNVGLNDSDLGIEKSKNTSSKIKNIVLFGIDQTEGDIGRSDAIIIATVDSLHKKLKLTSISRDSYVNIEGHGYDKLNHAYAYGQEELAIKTINQTFGLDITDYAKVNFNNLKDIIDTLGGIDITVEDSELGDLNGVISTSGRQHVNGTQALAYSRIRKNSGGDDSRTERQRMLLTEIFNKVSTVGILKLPSMVNDILPHVQTSLSTSEVLSLGTKVLTSGMTDIEQLRFPLAEHSKGDSIDGIYYTTFDEEITKEQIQKYIYEDVMPETSSN